MAPKHHPEAPDLFAPAPLPVAPLDDAERLNCLRLIRSDNVGPVAFRTLINRYGSAARALEALPDLARRGGARAIRLCPQDFAEAELDAAKRIGVTPLFTIEPGFPRALAVVDAPPPMLYVKGRIELLARPAVAIVGSRLCSAAGLKVARMFASELSTAGYVIVSGLARGIDGAAHEAALDAGTVAVVAGGIDIIYPPEHARLTAEISERGVIISEQPPGFRPKAQDFPRRNRIISGVSLGVVIVEAAARSGTLTTARHAADQGREVYAVPGHPLDSRAEGTNKLIQTGATLVTKPQDVVDALAPIAGFSEISARPFDARPTANSRSETFEQPDSAMRPAQPPEPDLHDADRAAVWAVLGPAPTDLDAVVRASGLTIRRVQAAILEFELAGRIARPGPGLVARAV